jgi:hypothetical protein
MSKRTVVLSCLFALTAAFAPALLRAQTMCTANPSPCSPSALTLNVSITIGRAIYMTLNPANTTLTVPSVANYNTGFAATTGPTVTVYCNTGWSVSISAGAALWTAVPTGTEPVRANKPAADLQWSLAAGGPFVDMLVTAASFGTSAAATSGTGNLIYYRTKYAWTLDTPGNYSIPVVFTLTSP